MFFSKEKTHLVKGNLLWAAFCILAKAVSKAGSFFPQNCHKLLPIELGSSLGSNTSGLFMRPFARDIKGPFTACYGSNLHFSFLTGISALSHSLGCAFLLQVAKRIRENRNWTPTAASSFLTTVF